MAQNCRRSAQILLRMVMLGSASLAVSCQAAPDPARAKALLVVVPNSSDVNFTQNTVSYRVTDRYPAATTIKGLRDAFQGLHCAVSEKDPFNPVPGLPFNRWTEYTPEDGGDATLVWTGAWMCQPGGDVVIFAFRTNRDKSTPAVLLEVKGAYYSAQQLGTIRKYVGAGSGSAAGSLFGSKTSRTGRSVSYETCSICGSTRKKVDDGPWNILHESPSAAGHVHHWESGVNSGVQVSDGRVVLARLRLALDVPSYAYGAFVLESQRLEPKERTDYKWILRTDGGSVLDPGNVAVSTGSARQQSAIAFGPFNMSWSGRDGGSGFVSYPRFPGAGRSSDDWELCFADLTSFERLDAADPRFVYKTSPVD